MRVRAMGLLWLAAVVLSANVFAQPAGALGAGAQPVQVETQAVVDQKTELAESILARMEEASGRAFDPWFRAATKQKLMALSVASLEAQTPELGYILNTLGDSSADLTYTPLPPCRIIDTRVAGGAIAAATTRDFLVAGATANLSSQGGSATGCGVPLGPATATVINFVAVGPAGSGYLQATPFGTPLPLASIINYTAGVNIANGLTIAICDPAAATCTKDFTIRASNTTHLVADVQGYFRRPVQLGPVKVVNGTPLALASFTCANHSSVTINVPSAGTVLVRADAVFAMTHTTATADEGIPFLGATATECDITHTGNIFTHLASGAPTGAYYFPFSISAKFAVTSAGAKTFYLNGWSQGGTVSIYSSALEATYYPN